MAPETGLNNFGKWLRTARKTKGWSGERLAEEVGTSQGNISLYERGLRKPHRERAVELAEALGADPREALQALIADTPGVDGNAPEVERMPTDEEWELIERYRGVTPGRRELLKRLWESAVEVIDKEPALEDIPEVR